MSFQEQIQGWQSELGRSKSSLQITYAYQRLKHLLIDYAKLNVLEFDQTAAQQVEQFRKAGIRIGTLDLRIASIAITFGFTVLTRNVSDFRLVPGLQVEDWSQ